MQTADWIAAASLGISLVALLIAWYAAFKANRNSSVATLVSLNESFRQAWVRFLQSSDDKERKSELSELMNLLEIGCGIRLERSISGMSKEIVTMYLNDALKLLIENQYTNSTIPSMMHAPTTFKYIKRFIDSRPAYLSVTIPPEWYQLAEKRRWWERWRN